MVPESVDCMSQSSRIYNSLLLIKIPNQKSIKKCQKSPDNDDHVECRCVLMMAVLCGKTIAALQYHREICNHVLNELNMEVFE